MLCCKVYISGPITGTTDYMERFEEAEEALKKEYESVINPARINAQMPKDTTHDEYMRLSIEMMKMADAVYFLDGWECSKGCIEEMQYAESNNMLKIFQETERTKQLNIVPPSIKDFVEDIGYCYKKIKPTDFAAAIHSGVSKILEEFRKGKSPTEIYYREGDEKPEGVPVELANILTICCEMATYYAMNLDRALRENYQFNLAESLKQENSTVNDAHKED